MQIELLQLTVNLRSKLGRGVMVMANWIKHDTLFDGIYYECSSCSSKFKYNEDVCPNCGKKMKGEKYSPDFVDDAFMMDMLGFLK